MLKYPRTQHIEGSRLQKGDHDLSQAPLSDLIGHHLVIEEKVDGANVGISFDNNGSLLLQSRGHYLRGGSREKQFSMFKQWADSHVDKLFEVLEDRYIMYGEWLYAKHTVFYDNLPHYFLEFDIFDTEKGIFLSTKRRRKMLSGVPVISVPVLWEGKFEPKLKIEELIGPSLYKSPLWIECLRMMALQRGLDPTRAVEDTDGSDLSEGLYIKDETEEETVGRYKFVRFDFLSAIAESETHWHDRPIIPNQLSDGTNIFI